MAIVLNGRETSAKVMEEVEVEVKKLIEKGITPGLGLVLTGTDRYSARYVNLKKRRAESIGINTFHHHLENPSQEEVLTLIEQLNNDLNVHGIMVQLPLAEGLDELETVEAILPEKDVDGLTPTTLGRLLMGEEAYTPAGVEAVIELFKRYDLDPEGKHWMVLGSSNFLSKPLLAYLANMNVQVTFLRENDEKIPEMVKEADVISTELFKKHFITADMVKEGVIVIDNGNNYEGKNVFGDVDTDAVMEKAHAITPVPGGPGPMLVSILLRNTVAAAARTVA